MFKFLYLQRCPAFPNNSILHQSSTVSFRYKLLEMFIFNSFKSLHKPILRPINDTTNGFTICRNWSFLSFSTPSPSYFLTQWSILMSCQPQLSFAYWWSSSSLTPKQQEIALSTNHISYLHTCFLFHHGFVGFAITTAEERSIKSTLSVYWRLYFFQMIQRHVWKQGVHNWYALYTFELPHLQGLNLWCLRQEANYISRAVGFLSFLPYIRLSFSEHFN